MNAHQVITRLRQSGFIVALEGEAFAVTPASELTPRQRQFLIRHKAEIIAALTHPEPANDAPIWVMCWTPYGNRVVVRANNQVHAESILRGNPKPPPGGWPK